MTALMLGLSFPPATVETIGKIRAVREVCIAREQVDVKMRDGVHAGMYYRTQHVPKGCFQASVLICKPTMLIISGDVLVYFGDDERQHFPGYTVLQGLAGRMQAFYTLADTDMTMFYATDAKTTEEAENELTPEPDALQSRRTA